MPNTENQHANLRNMIDGYQISQVIGVAATLGIADVIGDESCSIEKLSNQIGTDPQALSRLLLALETIGIVNQETSGNFTLSETGALLRSDHPASVRAIAMHAVQPSMWQAWGNLLASVQSGSPAFSATHGMNVWEYRDRNEDAGRVFDAAMADSQSVAAAIVEAYEFGETATVVDIGGGKGTLLTEILSKHHSLSGILFEQPRTSERARAAIAETNLVSRYEIVSGDFFESIPTGGDLYILKGVLHDWIDDQAAAILSTCHRCMPQNAKLLIIEQVATDSASAFARFMDLHMLVIHGGKERTAFEFESLLQSTGFALERMIPTVVGLAILEARRTDNPRD